MQIVISAPKPLDEDTRIETLRSLRVLDTAAEPVFDGLVQCAAQLTGCPIALVSLVAEDRQWFKAAHGLDARETPREVAFCAHAILGDALFEVPDALADPRFADNPLATRSPNVRFYAGQPVEVDGARVGTLCVMDHVPRHLDDAARAALRHLTHAVAHLLQQRRLSMQLLQTQDRLLGIARASGDWFWETDAQHRYVWLSKEFESVTGGSIGELLGRCVGARGADEPPVPGYDHLINALNKHRGFREEFVVDRSELQTRWYAYSAVPRFDANGCFAGHLGATRDITAQRNLSVDLDAVRERLALAVEGAGIGIAEWDVRSGELIVDTRTRATLALPADGTSLSIADWLATVHPDERAATEAQLQRARVNASAFKCEVRAATKGGGWRWCRVVARPHVDATGNALRFVSASWNVAAERDAESLRIEMKAAEEAKRAKSAMLSRVTHELRTPLNAIIGFSQLLQMDAKAPLDAAQRRRVEHIRAAGEQLLVLVNDLLDMSRFEAGHIELQWASVDVNEVVRNCLTLVEPLATGSGVQLGFSSSVEGGQIRADRRRLEQVLVNLLSNAIKYNQAQGRVEVSVARSESALRVSVHDDGPGIAPDDLKTIFEPFTRASRTANRVSGTGLGLAIARELARAMGGDIEVAAELGAGSTFSLLLPLLA